MNILLINWQDRANPHAGGAEIHLFEIFGRLAARGHRVRLICSGVAGRPPSCPDGTAWKFSGWETRDSFALLGRGAVRRARSRRTTRYRGGRTSTNSRCFSISATQLPFCAIVPHLFGCYRVCRGLLAGSRHRVGCRASASPGRTAGRDSTPLAKAPGMTWWHEACQPQANSRHPPRSGQQALLTGPGGRRGAARECPPSLYVGRLKRYKGMSYAIRALAVGTPADVPICAWKLPAPAITRGELERLAAQSGGGAGVSCSMDL